MNKAPVAIITGSSKRIGKSIAIRLHDDNFNVCLHYCNSREASETLMNTLNSRRPDSAAIFKADFSGGMNSPSEVSLAKRCARLIDFCYSTFGRCDVLVNNASAFYPTPLLGDLSSVVGKDIYETDRIENDILDIFGSNALAPLCLIRCFARKVQSIEDELQSDSPTHRCVVNLLDSMISTPLEGYSLYTMGKYAMDGLTKAAALELSKLNIRVNGVAPGLCVMPPGMSKEKQEAERGKVPLGQREASAEEIAAAVSFMVSSESQYITGSVLNVDGGISIKRA
ncbi:unnamed protein product [Phytomonas sp. Hart1]|nr:unnamed protein product [Phytomonas sp. Hart1]|eukprot:CCW68253.1 unnamed protein product [Phytomonas sp. isolate Hart1]